MSYNLYNNTNNFYPRSPCGERQYVYVWYTILVRFLSTLSLRRATDDFEPSTTRRFTFLSTLSLRRATCVKRFQAADMSYFYPRSPCGERRVVSSAGTTGKSFLSTLSLRRATRPPNAAAIPVCISIHALLAESDSRHFSIRRSASHFYPRSPCGERHQAANGLANAPPFLSTLSLRRATELNSSWISSIRNFYPRSPCGERQNHEATF